MRQEEQEKLLNIVHRLRTLPAEKEWVEFKHNHYNPEKIGENISALSNGACLCHEDAGYLVFGIEDTSHAVCGTSFSPCRKKVGNEDLESWLSHLLTPRVDFRIFEFTLEGKNIVMFIIDPAKDTPIEFKQVPYIRVGSYTKKLRDYPDKARKIWKNIHMHDWSAGICEKATIDHLDPLAIQKARANYTERKKSSREMMDTWDDITFLNKAKITIEGNITRTAILLLGKPESSSFLSPAQAQISWFLRDEQNNPKDYEHFETPFIMNVDKVLEKIRNLKIRILPPHTLIATELLQYDQLVIREALHNCIAHQDYEMDSRINVVERPDEIIFENAGSFIPGSVEAVIERNSPPKLYRNPFLAHAMVNCAMIETEGGGIREMFTIQRERFLPLPTYELEKNDEVRVRIPGKIIDENYTRLLITKTSLDLHTVVLIDKVQKKRTISRQEAMRLRKQNLVEGRYPSLFVSSTVAATTKEKAVYIKNKSFDKQYYKDLVIKFIDKYGEANRKEIDNLLQNKLPDILNERQKKIKINNLLNEMSHKDKSIRNIGTDAKSKWILSKNY